MRTVSSTLQAMYLHLRFSAILAKERKYKSGELSPEHYPLGERRRRWKSYSLSALRHRLAVPQIKECALSLRAGTWRCARHAFNWLQQKVEHAARDWTSAAFVAVEY
jgi:hypothetical protein